MSIGLCEQLEAGIYKRTIWNPDKPWQIRKTTWRRWLKTAKCRRERRRVKQNVECDPQYNRYHGYEF